MFPTFSGSSRRPRNVNLSGQRNTNPWASGASGASKTVAQAQAEREKRQRERDELNAAKKLQRVWRGHKGRQSFKQTCRERYDALYGQPIDHDYSQRVTSTLPLLLLFFNPTRTEDQHRLDLFIQDLATFKSDPVNFGLFDPNSWDRFAQLLVGALERYVFVQDHDYLSWGLTLGNNRRPASSSQALFPVLLDIIRRRQLAITPIINRYYKLLSKYFEQGNQPVSVEQQQILTKAVTVPLESNPEQCMLTPGGSHGEISNFLLIC